MGEEIRGGETERPHQTYKNLRSWEGVAKTSLGHHECVSRRNREPRTRRASETVLFRKRDREATIGKMRERRLLERQSVCEIRPAVDVG